MQGGRDRAHRRFDAVFAGREPMAELGADHVGLRLRTGDPLAQEWFVLALGPGLAITLCGLDGDAHVAQLQPVREPDLPVAADPVFDATDDDDLDIPDFLK